MSEFDCHELICGFYKWLLVWIVICCVHVALQVNVYKELEFSGAESKQDYFELVTDEWNGSAFYDITINTSYCIWP